MMGPPPRAVRRLLLTPVVWAGSLVLIVLSPVVFVVTLVLDVIDQRSWRFTRLLGLGVAFCALEFAALTAAFVVWVRTRLGGDSETVVAFHQSLLAWWLRSITAALRRCLDFSLEVRFPDTGTRPLVVLSRHAGPGDALFLMDELANGQGRQIRAVGKEKLLWDPFFDVVASRAGFVFLGVGDPSTLETVRSRSAMPPRGAFISFPEGGNFTVGRHGRALAGLRSAGQDLLADTAAGLRHLLLPRPGGVHAALAGSPEATVVFIGHAGYDDLDSLVDLWRAIPEGRRIRLEARAVARPDGWEDREVVREWLLRCWTDMDRWIRKHAANDRTDRAGDAR
ncbi:MAG: 1-acyl-sn-glycerol-3-phosphate acyltransferase [Acidimicrobiia bacterium]|jgi:1-acyl-sn-glycerol-3-phosphate acyltransferase